MSAITFSPADIQAIAAALAPAIVAQLRASTPPALSADDVLTAAEARVLLSAPTSSSFFRVRKKLGIRSITQGRYRRGDIENAVARATKPLRKAKEAAR